MSLLCVSVNADIIQWPLKTLAGRWSSEKYILLGEGLPLWMMLPWITKLNADLFVFSQNYTFMKEYVNTRSNFAEVYIYRWTVLCGRFAWFYLFTWWENP